MSHKNLPALGSAQDNALGTCCIGQFAATGDGERSVSGCTTSGRCLPMRCMETSMAASRSCSMFSMLRQRVPNNLCNSWSRIR